MADSRKGSVLGPKRAVGRWLKVVAPRHECGRPLLYPGYGTGSIWQCECGRRYELDLGMPTKAPVWRYLGKDEHDATGSR